jgi:hypothetical protein
MTEQPPQWITKHMMLVAGFSAFRELARRWKLTSKEQASLLAISASTLSRWKRKLPDVDETKLRRLRIVLLTYRRLLEVTNGDDDTTAKVIRQRGSADNPDAPAQSFLEGLCDRSTEEMDRHYLRLAAVIHGS